MNALKQKLKEVFFSVFPVALLVIFLNFTFVPLGINLVFRFILGAILIIAGLSLFLFGVDISVTPIGNNMGIALAKTNKLLILVSISIVVGFFVSLAEPDLHVLAKQVDMVTQGGIGYISLLVVVSIGIALFFSLGLVRILYNIPLYILLFIGYGVILILAFFASQDFLAVSFDASGATTGAMAVPFILAVSTGISSMKKDSKASEKDSFGLVAMASVGAIITVLIMSIISGGDSLKTTLIADREDIDALFIPFINKLPSVLGESFLALSPIVIIFLIFQKASFKLSKQTFVKIIKGLAYSLLGLVMFLLGVYAGFLDVGNKIGYTLSDSGYRGIIVAIGFALGLLTILAEPAVHVLTHRIEDVTGGYIRRKAVLAALSLGVGVSISLSMVRILVPGVSLWHFLMPGYLVALLLMIPTPKLFDGGTDAHNSLASFRAYV